MTEADLIWEEKRNQAQDALKCKKKTKQNSLSLYVVFFSTSFPASNVTWGSVCLRQQSLLAGVFVPDITQSDSVA